MKDTLGDRATSGDFVFETLRDEIITLGILPGTRISEVEIAKRFGLSRQPVRAAFIRLSDQGLLHIRPQRSSCVRLFSLTEIRQSRYIRTAVEVEVLRQACADRDTSIDTHLCENLARQAEAVSDNDPDAFHRLDYEFHSLLCQAARADFAFTTISKIKAQVDRLCMLSLTSQTAMGELIEDHTKILDSVLAGDAQRIETTIRRHLDRLIPTIDRIRETHPDYFED